jgi:hypothetical protein
MKCKKWRILLSSYIDGEITPFEKEKFTLHLKDCKRCQRELFSLKKLTSLTMTLDEVSPPPNLRDKIIEKMTERPKREGKWIALKGLAAAAVLLLLLYTWKTLPPLFKPQMTEKVRPRMAEEMTGLFLIEKTRKIHGCEEKLPKDFPLVEEERREIPIISSPPTKISLFGPKEIVIPTVDVNKKKEEIKTLLIEYGGKDFLEEETIQVEIPRERLHHFISRLYKEEEKGIEVSKEMDPRSLIPTNYIGFQRLNIRVVKIKD